MPLMGLPVKSMGRACGRVTTDSYSSSPTFSTSWSFMTPQQARLVDIAPDKAPVMLSLNASAIYLGVAIGSAIGGYALKHGGRSAVGLMGLLVALLGLGHLLWSDRLAKKARP